MKTKRIISVVVAAVLLLSTLCVVGLTNVFANEIEIDTAAEFKAITNGNYKLTADIDLSGADFTTIASFSGTINGNGKKITGITTPLFASFSGNVSDLTLEGAINDTATTTAIGALAETAGGDVTVSGVTNKVSITATASEAVGGLIGTLKTVNTVTIVSSTNEADITTSGNVKGTGGFIGTVVGTAKSSLAKVVIEKSVNKGDVHMTPAVSNLMGAGGMIGAADRYDISLTMCLNEGAITVTSTAEDGIGGLFGASMRWGNNADEARDKLSISYSANYGAITGEGELGNPGGLVGRMDRGKNKTYTFEYCYNTGAVTGGQYAGGIFGYTNKSTKTMKVVGCYNVGTVKGVSYSYGIGLCGTLETSNMTASDNYFVGKETKKSGQNEAVPKREQCADATTLYQKVTALGEYITVDGIDHAILIWQCPHTDTTEGCTGEICDICGVTVKESTNGQHAFSDWTVTVEPGELTDGEKTRTCSACGEVETVVLPATVSVTPVDGVYHIGTPSQLIWVMSGISSGDVPLDAKIKLTADIALTEGMASVVEGKQFSGTFDGDNHKISGLTEPLFFYCNGTVKNLVLEGAINSTNKRVGSIARRSEGNLVISNVHSTVDITLSAGNGNVGGLIGYIKNKATITNSSYNGTLAYNWTGTDAGVGGILGYANPNGKQLSIENTTFGGTLTVTVAEGVENTIWLGGIAGLAGANKSNSIVKCTATGTISLDSGADNFYVGGIVGKLDKDNALVKESVFKGTIAAAEGATVGAIAGYASNLATIENCGGLVDGLGVYGAGEPTVNSSYAGADAKALGEVFTLGGVSYQRYNFGFLNAETGAFVAGGMTTNDMFSAYFSTRDDGANHDVRIVLLANLELFGDVGCVTVSVSFMKGGNEAKALTMVAGGENSELEIFRAGIAAGEPYFAGEGHALFGAVVNDIPDGAWDEIFLEIQDTATSETLYIGEASYQ